MLGSLWLTLFGLLSLMAKFKTYTVDFKQSRRIGLYSNIGALLMRQDHWGQVNGETNIEIWDWNNCVEINPAIERKANLMAVADRASLLQLAYGALRMAGEEWLANIVPQGGDMTNEKMKEEVRKALERMKRERQKKFDQDAEGEFKEGGIVKKPRPKKKG